MQPLPGTPQSILSLRPRLTSATGGAPTPACLSWQRWPWGLPQVSPDPPPPFYRLAALPQGQALAGAPTHHPLYSVLPRTGSVAPTLGPSPSALTLQAMPIFSSTTTPSGGLDLLAAAAAAQTVPPAPSGRPVTTPVVTQQP